MKAVINNVLDLVFCFSCHQFRGRPCVIRPMSLVFVITGQQGGMEDVMNGPGKGKLQLISNWRYLFGNGKGAMMFRG